MFSKGDNYMTSCLLSWMYYLAPYKRSSKNEFAPRTYLFSGYKCFLFLQTRQQKQFWQSCLYCKSIHPNYSWVFHIASLAAKRGQSLLVKLDFHIMLLFYDVKSTEIYLLVKLAGVFGTRMLSCAVSLTRWRSKATWYPWYTVCLSCHCIYQVHLDKKKPTLFPYFLIYRARVANSKRFFLFYFFSQSLGCSLKI